MADLSSDQAHLCTDDLKPTAVLVDDDIFYRELLANVVGDVRMLTFASPEEFLEAIELGSIKLESIDAFILDYYFTDSSGMNGLDLAAILKQKTSPHSTIHLFSNAEFSDVDLGEVVDSVIPKGIISLEDLRRA